MTHFAECPSLPMKVFKKCTRHLVLCCVSGGSGKSSVWDVVSPGCCRGPNVSNAFLKIFGANFANQENFGRQVGAMLRRQSTEADLIKIDVHRRGKPPRPESQVVTLAPQQNQPSITENQVFFFQGFCDLICAGEPCLHCGGRCFFCGLRPLHRELF